MLDWSTLHPVERLELLTSHDLARQEKQKLELLRGLLTYYHYATTESRHEALQSEINRINAAANEQRDRYRSQFAVEKEAPQRERLRPPPRFRSTSCRPLPAPQQAASQSPPQRYDGLPPEYDDPPTSVRRRAAVRR